MILLLVVVCVCWLGCLALEGLRLFPVDPCVVEAADIAASYGPRYDDALARLRKAPPSSPEAQRLRQECLDLLQQSRAEVQEVYRRYGREVPSRSPEKREDRIGRLP
jgi:hypothetical protein